MRNDLEIFKSNFGNFCNILKCFWLNYLVDPINFAMETQNLGSFEKFHSGADLRKKVVGNRLCGI